jgi:fibronectin-binding autotransporter adhesin
VRALLTLLLLTSPLVADSVTSNWIGAFGNSWNNASNWDNGLPQNGADLFTAVISSSFNNPILLGSSVTISGLDLMNGSSVNTGAWTLTVNNGSFSINGTVNGSFAITGASSGSFTGYLGNLSNGASGVVNVAGANAGIGNFLNSSGGQIRISNNNALTLQPGGTYTNNGDIEVFAGGYLQIDAPLSNSPVTLAGTGTLTLSGGSVSSVGPQAYLVNAPTHSIVGRGSLDSGVTLANQGTVNASTGAMTLNGPVINTGLLTATNNQALTLNGTLNNIGGQVTADHGLVYLNGTTTGGTFTAQNQGTLNLSSVIINSQGTVTVNDSSILNLTASTAQALTVNGTGHVNVNDGILNGSTLITAAASVQFNFGTINNTLTNNGQLLVADNSYLHMGGGSNLINNSTISMTGGSLKLNSDGLPGGSNVTMSGSGTLILNNVGTVSETGAGMQLTNQPGHTIQFNGGTIASEVALSNLGVVTAAGVNWNGSVTNSNSITASGSSTWNGSLVNSGTVTLTGGSLAITARSRTAASWRQTAALSLLRVVSPTAPSSGRPVAARSIFRTL